MTRHARTVAGDVPAAVDDTLADSQVDRDEYSRPGDTADLTTLPVKDPRRYVRGREIARGGMGRIVSVRDRELKRDVAIKELLSPSPALEARFEREILISAQLQHPSIIAVLEAGRWPTGEAFYTMKHVEGRALDKVIAEKKTLSDRLSLLSNVLAVADALAYAHSRGVIHRDLKPANVLVGEYGETVVIDWGLAKDLSCGDDSDGLEVDETAGGDGLTVLGVALGTPAYMPPEQASGQRVDERSDVYSLGALLYHLLVGRAPYEDTHPTSASDLLDRVKDGPPTTPSAIAPDVPGDLLAIVAKAMARLPSERYADAGEMVEDLRRFETGQLVGAHDYSAWALLRRWVGRHRAAVVAGLAVLVTLALAGGLSFWRIARERDRAEEQRATAQEQRARAEENRDAVEDLLTFMLSDLKAKLEKVEQLDVLGMIAQRASEYYARYPVDWNRPEEVEQRIRAHRVLAETLEAQGAMSAALTECRASTALAERLARDAPADAGRQATVAASHGRVANVLRLQGDLDGALREYAVSKAIAERMLADAPDNRFWQTALSGYLTWIGDVLRTLGDLDGALREYRAGAAIRADLADKDPQNLQLRRGVALSRTRVGEVYQLRGDLDAALAEYRASQAIAEQLVENEPDEPVWRVDLASFRSSVGSVLEAKGDLDGALREYEASRTIHGQLVKLGPKFVWWKHYLAWSHISVGNVLRARGDLSGALADYATAAAIAEGVGESAPEDSQWRRVLAEALLESGSVHIELGDPAVARKEMSRSSALYAEVIAGGGFEAEDLYHAARVHSASGEIDEAFAMLDRAVERGFHGSARAQKERDLASLRSDPRWRTWVEKLGRGP